MDTHGMKQRRRRLAHMSHDTGQATVMKLCAFSVLSRQLALPHHIGIFFLCTLASLLFHISQDGSECNDFLFLREVCAISEILNGVAGVSFVVVFFPCSWHYRFGILCMKHVLVYEGS